MLTKLEHNCHLQIDVHDSQRTKSSINFTNLLDLKVKAKKKKGYKKKSAKKSSAAKIRPVNSKQISVNEMINKVIDSVMENDEADFLTEETTNKSFHTTGSFGTKETCFTRKRTTSKKALENLKTEYLMGNVSEDSEVGEPKRKYRKSASTKGRSEDNAVTDNAVRPAVGVNTQEEEFGTQADARPDVEEDNAANETDVRPVVDGSQVSQPSDNSIERAQVTEREAHF